MLCVDRKKNGQLPVKTHFKYSIVNETRTYCSPARTCFPICHPFVTGKLFDALKSETRQVKILKEIIQHASSIHSLAPYSPTVPSSRILVPRYRQSLNVSTAYLSIWDIIEYHVWEIFTVLKFEYWHFSYQSTVMQSAKWHYNFTSFHKTVR